MNDQVTVAKLRSKERDKVLIKLYRYYPKVEKLVLSKGGNKQDAQDIFQEALIALCKKLKDEEFELTSSINTYIYSVCRFLWSNELKKRNRNSKVEILVDLSAEEEEELNALLEKEMRLKAAIDVLSKLGEKCLKILQMFYYQSLKMREIASEMGFSNEKIAKNQKYKCLERAKLKLKEV